ncbi:putative membrane spanning protein [Granulibacter bethesdensis]|uniref:Membrane spanning protein n=1 Tax=Granulibacter bethesdensis (strain ATCC BAA-1260 / CGDNIH1) TaxID=391165 RepID=Q0BQM7_GRABC|nr:putative membrane spanning protein [Granulibacter bethesdensis CGDNIH1]AHJ68168.1 putative membrane spanning protein [Granulibacter bethesdensis]APH52743.1 putative membrane spanning protein [Granulibacter bethesdensis]APH65431.1 putative membrane spanning protein [Granulibacter bethesdensis]
MILAAEKGEHAVRLACGCPSTADLRLGQNYAALPSLEKYLHRLAGCRVSPFFRVARAPFFFPQTGLAGWFGRAERLQRISILAALLGLALATGLIGWFGLDQVLDATLRIGWKGLGLLCLLQVPIFLLLGRAWRQMLPGNVSFWLPVWCRMVRDAASTCLPFSQIGGLVLGARAATLWGLRWPVAAASTIVDVTCEFLAQLIFALLGLSILLASTSSGTLLIPAVAGVVVAGLAGWGAVWVQRHGVGPIMRALASRVAAPALGDGIDCLEMELTQLSANLPALLRGIGWHFLAWMGSGVATWLTAHMLGVQLLFIDALAVEGMMHGLVAGAFMVPGLLGVQEAAYVALGSVFGVPPDIAIGISLVRRARDLLVGVPILLGWQMTEARALRR